MHLSCVYFIVNFIRNEKKNLIIQFSDANESLHDIDHFNFRKCAAYVFRTQHVHEALSSTRTSEYMSRVSSLDRDREFRMEWINK